MDQENEIPHWQPVSAGSLAKGPSSKFAAYETSLLGEYARLILLLLAFPLVVLFARSVAQQQLEILCLTGASLLLVSLVTPRGNQVFRVGLLVALTMNVFAMAASPIETFRKFDDAPLDLATNVLAASLAVASFFEARALAKSLPRKTQIKTLAWGILAIPTIVYIVGIPIFELIWDGIDVDERKNALKDPDWNLLNEAAFRSAKFFVFAVFTYVGACVGSFLNVVAYCVPRGEAIGVRDSKCPLCDTKIGRIDNLPIFGYINLGAKCRSCSAAIASRYLIVELVVAFIFGSLFLYELVTGCSNVPTMKVTHTGILWIILYPKWHVIAMYFYHSFFMCFLLVLALIEWDKQPLKPVFSIIVALGFFLPAAIYHTIQPVPLFEHLSGALIEFSPGIEQPVKLTVGAIIGAAIGGFIARAFSPSHLCSVAFAFALTGVVLGWQALLQVTVFFGLLAAASQALPIPNAKCMRCSPTTILLVAVALHHPFWNIIALCWRS